MELAQLLGWVATFLFSVMIIPQMIKTIKLKDTSGVSLLLFITYLIANTVALIYAFMIHQTPLIIKYIIAIITTVVYLALYRAYYKRSAN